MASERVLEVVVRRHVFTSNQPFPAVLDGIFSGISQPRHQAAVQQAREQHLLRAVQLPRPAGARQRRPDADRKSTRLNSSHGSISYAVFCLKKKKNNQVRSSYKQQKQKQKQT